MRGMPVVMVIFGLLLSFSCGGPASYTTPIVMDSRIVQSECRPVEGSEGFEEQITVQVRDGLVEVRHENIFLPRGTVLGIVDQDGRETWRNPAPYYYLDADTDYITVRESAHLVSSEELCLYDLTVTIQSVSGGEYTFYLFDYRGRMIESATTRISMR